MAKFTLGGSWIGGFFSNLFGGNYSRARRDERRIETAECKLRRQQLAHRARIHLLDKEIAESERDKLLGAKQRNRELVLSSIQKRRRAVAKRTKYQQLYDFCDSMLESLQDASTINQTMGAIQDVRLENRAIDMTKMYDRLGNYMNDYDSFRNEARLAQSLFADATTMSASSEQTASPECEIDPAILKELEEVMASEGDPTPDKAITEHSEAPSDVPEPDMGSGMYTGEFANVFDCTTHVKEPIEVPA